MPAFMAKRSSSERCAIRRELHRRRKLAVASAPKGGIVKKSSTAASIEKKPSADEPAGPAIKKPSSMTMPMSRPRAGVATPRASILQHAPAPVASKKQLAAAAKEIAACVPLGCTATAPPRRSALIPAASKMKVSGVIKRVPNKSASTWVKKGMTVKVRTRAGMLSTGHCLVLWLAARVVSDAAADEGYVEVIYNSNFPRDDPSRTVRVAMDDVRSMPASADS